MDVIEYKRNLNALIDNGELALPDNVPIEAFRNAAVVAYTDNPKIASCTPQSIFQAIRRLAYMGLVPDGQEAAIVPFKTKDGNNWVDKAQAMPMVAGLIKRARNSAEIKDIRAHIVYQNEVDRGLFQYQIGDVEKLEHTPILFGEKGAPVGCYAIATMKDGSIVRAFMDAGEVDQVRRAGSSQKIFKQGQRPVISDTPIGIWADWQGEMWKKTVIRRLCKRLSMSSDDRRRIMDDDEFEQMRDVTPQREPLQDRIAKKNLADHQPGKGADGEQQMKGTTSGQSPSAEAPESAVEDADVVGGDDAMEGEIALSDEISASDGRPDQWQSVIDQIVDDFRSCDTEAAVDAVADMFYEQIEQIEGVSKQAHKDLLAERQAAYDRVEKAGK